MDIRKKYTEETGKLYFNEEDYNVGWDDDYVHWLEDNLVKLFTTPDVVGRSEQSICHHCGKYKRLQGNGIMHQLCECGE